MKKQLIYSILMTVVCSLFVGTSFSQTAEPTADRKAMLTPDPSDAELEALFKYFRMKVEYPKEARSNNVQANLLVLVQVDDNGKGSVSEIIGENQEYFSEQVTSVVENYPDQWAASYHGKKVAMPIVFRLDKGKEMEAPSSTGLSYDKRLTPVVVVGYSAAR